MAKVSDADGSLRFAFHLANLTPGICLHGVEYRKTAKFGDSKPLILHRFEIQGRTESSYLDSKQALI